MIKKATILLFIVFSSIITWAQNPLKLSLQKDVYGNIFNYLGETKNGKPNGEGLATYASGDKLYGLFNDGFANGHCIFFFADGRALVGNFKAGKADGDIVLMRKDGSIYIGGFKNDTYEGYASVLTQQNLFSAGWYKNGLRNGQGIEIGAEGFIFDGIYMNDRRNGEGLQYEPKQKVFYEGMWKADKWVGPAKTNLVSFLKSATFKGFSEPGKIVAANIDSTKKLLNDTCLLFRPKTGERFFGRFKDGIMQKGFHVTADSIRYWGDWGPKGGEGKGVYGKKGKYLGVGYFKDGKMDGLGTYVNIEKRSIYDGELNEGKLTGKATLVNASNTIMMGNFLDGMLEGEGKMLYENGTLQSGTFDNGKPVVPNMIMKANGRQITCQPLGLENALNILLNEYGDNFDVFRGQPNKRIWLISGDSSYVSTDAFFVMPEANFSSVVEAAGSHYFVANMMDTLDTKIANSLYKILCKKIEDMAFTIDGFPAANKWRDKEYKMHKEGSNIIYTIYSLVVDADKPKPYITVLMITEKARATVSIILGDKLLFNK